MLSIFTTQSAIKSRPLSYPQMNYIQKRHKDNLERARSYYRTSGEAVASNHILVSLIIAMNVAWAEDTTQFFDACDNVSPGACNALKIGSNIHAPRLIKKGPFYGSHEVIFSTTLDRTNLSPWYNIKPVKVFAHNDTEIRFSLPDGTKVHDGQDLLSVVAVDVGLLLYMFHHWKLYQAKVNPDAMQTIPHFIANWVLPNMIEDHNDVSWINRITAEFDGVEYSTGTSRPTPFSLPSAETFTRAVVTKMVSDINRAHFTWLEILAAVALPSGATLFQYSRIPKFYATNIGKVLSSLSSFYVLMLLTGKQPLDPKNDRYAVEFLRLYRRFESERWISDMGINGYLALLFDYVNQRLGLDNSDV